MYVLVDCNNCQHVQSCVTCPASASGGERGEREEEKEGERWEGEREGGVVTYLQPYFSPSFSHSHDSYVSAEVVGTFVIRYESNQDVYVSQCVFHSFFARTFTPTSFVSLMLYMIGSVQTCSVFYPHTSNIAPGSLFSDVGVYSR